MRCLEKKNLVQRENCVLNLITKNRRFSLSIFRCAVPSHAAVSKCVKRSDKSYCSTRELNVSLADNKASVIAAPEIPVSVGAAILFLSPYGTLENNHRRFFD